MSAFILKLLTGSQAGVEVALSPGVYSVGSGEEDDLQFNELSLKPGHLKLRVSDKRVEIAAGSGSVRSGGGLTLEAGDESWQEVAPLDILTAGMIKFAIGGATAQWPSIVEVMDASGASSKPESESSTEETEEGAEGEEDAGEIKKKDVPPPRKAGADLLKFAAVLVVVGGLVGGVLWFFPLNFFEETETTETVATLRDISLAREALEPLEFARSLDIRQEVDGVIYITGYVHTLAERRAVLQAIQEAGVSVRPRIQVLDVIDDGIENLLRSMNLSEVVFYDLSDQGDLLLEGDILDPKEAERVVFLIGQQISGLRSVESQIKTSETYLKEVAELAKRSQLGESLIFRLETPELLEVSGFIPNEKADLWAGFLRSYLRNYSDRIGLRSYVQLLDAQGQRVDSPTSAGTQGPLFYAKGIASTAGGNPKRTELFIEGSRGSDKDSATAGKGSSVDLSSTAGQSAGGSSTTAGRGGGRASQGGDLTLDASTVRRAAQGGEEGRVPAPLASELELYLRENQRELQRLGLDRAVQLRIRDGMLEATGVIPPSLADLWLKYIDFFKKKYAAIWGLRSYVQLSDSPEAVLAEGGRAPFELGRRGAAGGLLDQAALAFGELLNPKGSGGGAAGRGGSREGGTSSETSSNLEQFVQSLGAVLTGNGSQGSGTARMRSADGVDGGTNADLPFGAGGGTTSQDRLDTLLLQGGAGQSQGGKKVGDRRSGGSAASELTPVLFGKVAQNVQGRRLGEAEISLQTAFARPSEQTNFVGSSAANQSAFGRSSDQALRDPRISQGTRESLVEVGTEGGLRWPTLPSLGPNFETSSFGTADLAAFLDRIGGEGTRRAGVCSLPFVDEIQDAFIPLSRPDSRTGRSGVVERSSLSALARHLMLAWSEGALSRAASNSRLSELDQALAAYLNRALDALSLAWFDRLTQKNGQIDALQATPAAFAKLVLPGLPECPSVSRQCWSTARLTQANFPAAVFWLDFMALAPKISLSKFTLSEQAILLEAALNPVESLQCARTLPTETARNLAGLSLYLSQSRRNSTILAQLIEGMGNLSIPISGTYISQKRFVQMRNGQKYEEGAVISGNTRVFHIGTLGIVFSVDNTLVPVLYNQSQLSWAYDEP